MARMVLRVAGTNTAGDALGKASRKHVQMLTCDGNLLELVSMTAFFSAKALRSGGLKAWCPLFLHCKTSLSG